MHTVLSNRMALELEYPIQVCGYVVVVVFFVKSGFRLDHFENGVFDLVSYM